MNLLWTEIGWEDYIYWQSQDKKTLRRINGLYKELHSLEQVNQNLCDMNFRDVGVDVLMIKIV